MPPEPVPADPGWDEDLAWLDRDPEWETWLDRAREHDDPPEEEEDGHLPELTPDELAEIKDAAADELLAVEAATTGPGPPPGETRFGFTPASRDGPPGGHGTWRLRTAGPGPDLIITLESLTTDPCDHRHEAKGHDPGARLRHLSQIRHATCTSPVCRRPAAQADFEHNTPYEAGGRTCLCNGGPKCRHDHRLKQHPKWKVDQLPDGTFRWTTPTGRTYTAEPTRYPI
jgi:hypothetical protein